MDIKMIRNEVAQTITNETVREAVIQGMVDREVTRRVGLLTTSMDKLQQMQREHDKIRPDSKTYTFDGDKKVEHASWTPAQVKKREDSSKKIEKLEKGIEAALNGDYSKLN